MDYTRSYCIKASFLLTPTYPKILLAHPLMQRWTYTYVVNMKYCRAVCGILRERSKNTALVVKRKAEEVGMHVQGKSLAHGYYNTGNARK